jgi:hypothetical protein
MHREVCEGSMSPIYRQSVSSESDSACLQDDERRWHVSEMKVAGQIRDGCHFTFSLNIDRLDPNFADWLGIIRPGDEARYFAGPSRTVDRGVRLGRGRSNGVFRAGRRTPAFRRYLRVRLCAATSTRK